MNREIKFRGKDIDLGVWCYGDLLQHNDEDVCIGEHDEHWTDDGLHWNTYRQVIHVDEDTVGQYTGLKDKNRVEIYPGDILFSKGKIIGYVVDGVRAYCYDVMYINHPRGEKRWSLWATVTVDYDGNIEVKGNIYDNPELINKEENE